MSNDAEYLIETIDGKRYYQGQLLMPSIMLWKCTVEGCQTPPKPQRRGQYKDKIRCNSCSNKEKIKDPAFLVKRGKAISKAIKNSGTKWADVARKNMESEESRDKISASMKEYCKNNRDFVVKKTTETAIKNNQISGFGTSSFSKEKWSSLTPEQRVNRSDKATTGQVLHDRQVHIQMMNERYPGFNLVEFGKTNNLYECPKKHIFYMRSNNFLKRGSCPECAPKSKVELDLFKWAQGIIPDVMSGRRVLYLTDENNGNKAMEIDIYSKSSKLGIEVNGLYYHKTTEIDSKYSVPKDYHQKKADLADKHGIFLLQFFEDEINSKLEIVRSIIKSKIHKNDKIVYARQCEIKIVNGKEKDLFLESNHLQGKCKSFLNVGLYHNNKLISLLTFRRQRKTEKIVEIARFSNATNHSVVGGFSKLLKHSEEILKKASFTEIVTYSDRRYSAGDLYKNNGFIYAHTTEPDMFWTKGGLRFARQISWGKTETEMLANKYHKIYGAGHILWTKQLI